MLRSVLRSVLQSKRRSRNGGAPLVVLLALAEERHVPLELRSLEVHLLARGIDDRSEASKNISKRY